MLSFATKAANLLPHWYYITFFCTENFPALVGQYYSRARTFKMLKILRGWYYRRRAQFLIHCLSSMVIKNVSHNYSYYPIFVLLLIIVWRHSMRIYSIKYFAPLLYTSSSFLFVPSLSYHLFLPFHPFFMHFLFTLESGSDCGLSFIFVPATPNLCLQHTILL